MWRGKTPARKNHEFILAGVGLARKKSKFSSPGQGWRGKKSKFSSPGHVSPHQNIQIPRQKYKFLAKIHKNGPIPRHGHGEKKVKIFPAGAGLARKKSSFSPPGVTWRGKISIFDPGNSRHSPPLLAIPRKMSPRKKNAVA